MSNVLAVIGDGEESTRQALGTAIALAEARNARLTLVKTCDAGRAYVWIAPFAVGAAYMPPLVESPEEAARLLSRVVELVPRSIPVTMLVLGSDTQGSLLKLVHTGDYGAVVADAHLLSHCWRLRRLLRRDHVETVWVTRHSPEGYDASTIPPDLSSNEGPEDGALNAGEVSEGNRSRRLGMWPWHTRRLAGAGGDHQATG